MFGKNLAMYAVAIGITINHLLTRRSEMRFSIKQVFIHKPKTITNTKHKYSVRPREIFSTLSVICINNDKPTTIKSDTIRPIMKRLRGIAPSGVNNNFSMLAPYPYI